MPSAPKRENREDSGSVDTRYAMNDGPQQWHLPAGASPAVIGVGALVLVASMALFYLSLSQRHKADDFLWTACKHQVFTFSLALAGSSLLVSILGIFAGLDLLKHKAQAPMMRIYKPPYFEKPALITSLLCFLGVIGFAIFSFMKVSSCDLEADWIEQSLDKNGVDSICLFQLGGENHQDGGIHKPCATWSAKSKGKCKVGKGNSTNADFECLAKYCDGAEGGWKDDPSPRPKGSLSWRLNGYCTDYAHCPLAQPFKAVGECSEVSKEHCQEVLFPLVYCSIGLSVGLLIQAALLFVRRKRWSKVADDF